MLEFFLHPFTTIDHSYSDVDLLAIVTIIAGLIIMFSGLFWTINLFRCGWAWLRHGRGWKRMHR